jgi:hypothetical protein
VEKRDRIIDNAIREYSGFIAAPVMTPRVLPLSPLTILLSNTGNGIIKHWLPLIQTSPV